MGYIYAHINKMNHKAYIGQTVQNPIQRWHNGYGYIHNPKFYAAIKKYGWNNFEHIVIEEVPDIVLDESEKFWIFMFDSVINGYNLEYGGNKQKIIPEYVKKAISKANKGNKYAKGHILSLEGREKIIKANKCRKGHPMSELNKIKLNEAKYKKIICIDDNLVFESIKEACKYYNLEGSNPSSNIVACCKGKKKSAYGHYFKYYEES